MIRSFFLRLLPSCFLVAIVKGLVGSEDTVFLWPEIIAVAFVWTSIYKFLGKKTPMAFIEFCMPASIIVIIISMQLEISPINRLIFIALSINLGVTAFMEHHRHEITLRDRIRTRKFLIYNIFDVRRLYRFLGATYKLISDGAKTLGKELGVNYLGDAPLFKETNHKIVALGYKSFWYGTKRLVLLGKDGIIILRLLSNAGEYEFKKNKWYKDKKKCTDISKELKTCLDMLSKERGTNRAIIVKAFEGGKVDGAGCGYFVTDITKGDDRLISEIKKTITPDTVKTRLDKKTDRVFEALCLM